MKLLSLLRRCYIEWERPANRVRCAAAHATHAGTYSYYFAPGGSGPIRCVCLAWAWPYCTNWRSPLMLRTICKSSQTAEKRVARGRMRKVAAVPDSYASDAVVAPADGREITYHAVILRLTALLVFFSPSTNILRFRLLPSTWTPPPPRMERQASMSQRAIHWRARHFLLASRKPRA